MQALNHPANRAFLAGDLAAAEELVELTVPWSVGIGAGRLFAEATIVANRRLQGRDDEVLSRFERAAARSSDAWYRCSLAAVQARSGRTAEARQTLAQLRDEGFPIREIYPWSIAVTDLAEAAEVVGDRAAAAHVLRVGGPYSGRIAVSGPSPNRPWDQALAQAALATGDVRAAVAHAAPCRRGQPPSPDAHLPRPRAGVPRRGPTARGDPAVGPLVREALEIAVPLGAERRRPPMTSAARSTGSCPSPARTSYALRRPCRRLRDLHGDGEPCRHLVGHRRAQPQQEAGDLVVGPLLPGDDVDDVEQFGGQLVAPRLVAGERALSSAPVAQHGDDGPGQQLGIAQWRR